MGIQALTRTGPQPWLLDQSPALLRSGDAGEVVLTLLHGRLYEQSIRAGIFTAVTPPVITKVGATWGGTQATNTNITSAMASHAVTIGSFVVLGVTIRSAVLATGLSVASSIGNTYTSLVQVTQAAGQSLLIALFAGFVTNAGNDVITWSWTNAGAASSTATAWANVAGNSAATALDIAIPAPVTQAAGTVIASATTLPTVTANDLIIAYTGEGGPTLTFSNQQFTPSSDAPISVPDTGFQSSAGDASLSQFSSAISGPAGQQHSFSLQSSATGAAGSIIAAFRPAAVPGGVFFANPTALFGLSNPVGSGVLLSVLRVEMALTRVAFTLAPGYGALYVTTPGITPVTGAVVPAAAMLGPPTNQGQALTNLTLPGVTSLYRPLLQRTITQEAPPSPPPVFSIDFDGTCVLTPGCALSLAQNDATDTAPPTAVCAVVWEEIAL